MSTEYIIYALMVVGIFTVYMALVHIFKPDERKKRIQRTAADAFYEIQDEKRTPAFASFCAGMVALTGVDVKNQKELQLTLARRNHFGVCCTLFPVL